MKRRSQLDGNGGFDQGFLHSSWFALMLATGAGADSADASTGAGSADTRADDGSADAIVGAGAADAIVGAGAADASAGSVSVGCECWR